MDNPTIGEYTQGISGNTVRYFENLERRIRREKAPVRGVAIDLQNPLFAIINGPLDPMGLDQKGRVKRAPQTVKNVKNVDKSVDKRPVQDQKKSWKTVNLADLRDAIDQVRMLRQDQKSHKRR